MPESTKSKNGLTRSEALEYLKLWQKLKGDNDLAYQLLKAATGCEPESPVAGAMFILFDAYTDLLAKLLGDESEWLSWYAWDNQMGKRGMSAGYTGSTKRIKTLKDLLGLIWS